jgi:hypothetical protein
MTRTNTRVIIRRTKDRASHIRCKETLYQPYSTTSTTVDVQNRDRRSQVVYEQVLGELQLMCNS